MSRARTTLLCTFSLLLAGCASAGDRFEEGMEAEAYGQYYQADHSVEQFFH